MRRWLLAGPLVLLVVVTAGIAVAGRPTKRLDDAERGKQLYERHCVQCHGATVGGDGAATAALVAKVPDLRDAKLTEANLEDMVIVVLDGKGPMPSFETSFDRYDARRLLRYMRTLADGKTEVEPVKEAPEPPSPDEEG